MDRRREEFKRRLKQLMTENPDLAVEVVWGLSGREWVDDWLEVLRKQQETSDARSGVVRGLELVRGK